MIVVIDNDRMSRLFNPRHRGVHGKRRSSGIPKLVEICSAYKEGIYTPVTSLMMKPTSTGRHRNEIMTKVPHVRSIINYNDSVIVGRKDSFEILFASSTGRLKMALHDSRIVSREDPIIKEPSLRIKDVYNRLGVAAAAHRVDVQFKEPCHAG